ncbi:MAG: hypothetical protein CMF44_02780 [Legionellales bacterium]|nr:hypothetical protein [Legionellales bacterium]
MSTERQQVLQRACDFLARREHARDELSNKLARACDDQALIEELLDKLSSEGLQSDKRFAESFVNHRINSGKGPLKIQLELRQRGIDKSLIRLYLESASINWLSHAEMARVKRFGEKPPINSTDRIKQSKFLLNRGFSSQLITELLS